MLEEQLPLQCGSADTISGDELNQSPVYGTICSHVPSVNPVMRDNDIVLTGETMKNVSGSKSAMALLAAGLCMSAPDARSQEIEILSSTSISIPDGESQTSAFATTHLGDCDVNGGGIGWYFQIYNTAPSSTLTFGGNATLSGSHPGDFSITTQPVGPLQNLVNQTEANCAMGVLFDPTVAGLRIAVVTVTSNDANEGTYTFAVSGTGTTGLQNAPSDTRITPFGTPKVKFNSNENLLQIKGKFELANTGPSPSEGAIVRIYVVEGLNLPMATLLGTPAQTIIVKPVKALLYPSLDKSKKVSFKVTYPGNFAFGRVYATVSPLPGTLTEDYWLDNVNSMDVLPAITP
jgi:hypothetical protein